MARLSFRQIATACGETFPLSLRGNILNGQAGALKEPFAVMQAECMPWEVIVQDSGHMAIHAALMLTGEILYFGGWFESEGIYRFNVTSGSIDNKFESDLPNTDMFCGGHALLADGRLLVGGGELPAGEEGEDLHGHGGMTGGGSRACWLYEPRRRIWDQAASLNLDPAGDPNSGGRWYPTLATLYDNQVIAVGGHPDVREAYPSEEEDEQRHSNNTPERYSPPNNSWTLLTAETTAVNGIRDEYHRIFLLPNGHIFFATQVKDFNRYYNPYSGTFLNEPLIAPPPEGIYHQGSRGTAVLLPLLPADGYIPRVLVCNGEQARRITLSGDSPSWEQAGTRSWDDTPPERNHGCSVILPNGQVFLSGGTEYSGGDDPLRQQNAVRNGEIYDPSIDWESGTYDEPSPTQWTTVEQASVPRHYHSVALLMPNGTVWTAGSNGPGGEENQERRIETYRPPYCAEFGRPEITDSPDYIVYGRTFEVRTPEAGNIQRVALIRNGSVTHAFDSDQRYVGLTFSHTGGDRLAVTAPPHSAVAPPGHYTLWIIDASGRPCKMARFVNLSAISVRITAAACGLSEPVSLLQDVFTIGDSQTKSLRRQLHVMQRECLF
jgi:galactose oxidase-like protein